MATRDASRNLVAIESKYLIAGNIVEEAVDLKCGELSVRIPFNGIRLLDFEGEIDMLRAIIVFKNETISHFIQMDLNSLNLLT